MNLLLFPLHTANNSFIKDVNDLAANRAFLYGDGFFESMRWHNGKINFFDDHFLRIEKSFDILKFKNTDLKKEILLNNIAKVLGEIKGDARVRMTFFRVADGYYAPEDGNVAAMISVNKLDTENYTLNKPITTGIYREHFKSRHTLSNLKSINSLVFVMAGIHAKEYKLDEILILNDTGNICEANSSNFFLVKNNIIYTPPLTEGCVDGVMRIQIIHLAEKLKISLQQKPIAADELKNADEVFFSSGVRGIITVGSFENKQYSSTITKQLYRELIR